MKNLFIMGIKHSGKTTFARLLSEHLGLPSIDSDDLILDEIRPLSIREYYRMHGQDSFKKTEAASIRKYIENRRDSVIMSLGGGASDNPELLKYLKEHGLLIYLKRNESEMLSVILKHGIPAFLDENDLTGSFSRLYARRDKIYSEAADKIIEMGSYRDRKETLLSLIEQLGDIIR